MTPVLPLVITVTVIVAGRLVARRASGHRLSTGPQRFLDAASVDVVDPIHSVGGLGERFDAAAS